MLGEIETMDESEEWDPDEFATPPRKKKGETKNDT